MLTVGAGVAAAMLVLLGGGLTPRRIVLMALVPVAALALLIAIDLGLSGGGHLSRNLTRASDATELWELVARRYELAWPILTRGGHAAGRARRAARGRVRVAQPRVAVRRPAAPRMGGGAGRRPRRRRRPAR